MAVRGVVIFCWIYARFVRSSTGWKIFRGWSLLSPCFFPDPYLGVQSGPPLRLCSTTVEGGISQFIPDTKVNSTHPPQPLYAALTEQVRLWRKKHTPIRCTWKKYPKFVANPTKSSHSGCKPSCGGTSRERSEEKHVDDNRGWVTPLIMGAILAGNYHFITPGLTLPRAQWEILWESNAENN